MKILPFIPVSGNLLMLNELFSAIAGHGFGITAGSRTLEVEKKAISYPFVRRAAIPRINDGATLFERD